LSAINNWEQKSGESAENVELYVKTIFVNEGKMLKRFQPAPQGRAYRIRKRSNHVSITLENKTA
jgi:large subunit ribosomal protein L22